MAGLIRRSDIDEVRARVNLADIVGDYVTLKSAGVGSMKGLCPFHEERSPSFHVRPQVGYYHCFGCGEGGDVFTFLQKMDHVTFAEAVERMAARIGYEVHYEDGGQATDHGNRARILAANKSAEDFFIAQLATPDAEPARMFLGQRGFDQAAAERFGVGFAPKSFDALGKHLKSLGYTELELVTAGLLSQNDRGSVYDRFRGRLVWPIRDVTGQTLGFGARKLLDDDKGPKYLNTPETPVYHKSQVLYGLDLAKRDVARGKQIVIVEGYTDVMACHLAGVTTAVATCGTAFGGDHVKIVRRVLGDFDNADTTGTGEVIFTFDPDEAGQKAASRAFSEEQRFAAQTFVAVAPDGLDPCDLRLQRGDDAVRRLVRTRKPMFEFMIRRTLADHNLETVEGRVAALRAAAPVVAGIRDQAMNSGYTRNLAGWLGMDPSEVTRAVSSARAATTRASGDHRPGDRTTDRGAARQQEAGRTPAAGSSSAGSYRQGFPSGQPQAGTIAAGNAPSVPSQDGAQRPGQAGSAQTQQGAQRPGGSAPLQHPGGARAGGEPTAGYDDRGGQDDYYAGSPEPGPSIMDLPMDPATRLERDAIMAMLQYPTDIGREMLARAARVSFTNATLAVVRDAIATSLDTMDTPGWLPMVVSEVPAPFATIVQQLAIAPIPERGEKLAAYCKGVTTNLVERDLLRAKADLLGSLQRTDSAADPERYSRIQRDLMNVEIERRVLRSE
ncbi:DNA primase [Glaciihabitans sp. dw_435]|uniref:DNA primase n=1 Tax=Glaciihabitans sp. dw_435 TaxID=2720081 RepID=UPI001BD5FCD3|nr:DNA primase [Glaciihabitans sp. dw_435]